MYLAVQIEITVSVILFGPKLNFIDKFRFGKYKKFKFFKKSAIKVCQIIFRNNRRISLKSNMFIGCGILC
jgi:hypothetical protein